MKKLLFAEEVCMVRTSTLQLDHRKGDISYKLEETPKLETSNVTLPGSPTRPPSPGAYMAETPSSVCPL